MRPGTPHSVFTVRDSVCFGGMYFFPSMFSDSLNAIADHHTHGQILTNSDHPGAHLYLYHLVGFYSEILKEEGWFSDPNGTQGEPVQYQGLYDRLLRGKLGLLLFCM